MHIFNHRKVSSRQNQDPFLSRIGNDPHVDWLIMLVSCVGAITLFAAAGFAVYSEVNTRLSAPATTAVAGQSSVFDPDALMSVLKVFNDRAAAKDTIIQGVGISGDPSL